jgi:hypothetical protein
MHSTTLSRASTTPLSGAQHAISSQELVKSVQKAGEDAMMSIEGCRGHAINAEPCHEASANLSKIFSAPVLRGKPAWKAFPRKLNDPGAQPRRHANKSCRLSKARIRPILEFA